MSRHTLLSQNNRRSLMFPYWSSLSIIGRLIYKRTARPFIVEKTYNAASVAFQCGYIACAEVSQIKVPGGVGFGGFKK